jgi:hypothetical protein
VRIPSRRGDSGFFHRVETDLKGCPAVDELYVNPTTASVLVLHRGALDVVMAYAAHSGLFGCAADGAQQARFRASVLADLRRLDQGIREATRQEVDLGGVGFAALAGCALYQLWRGEVLAPAATLLWYAAGTLASSHRAGADPGG